MIDVFGLAGNATQSVNSFIPATLKASNGYTVNSDFSITPVDTDVRIWIEVQAVSSQDLLQIENINQQADMRAVYIKGGIKALNRPLQYGGDIINFYGSDWLVTQSLEEWGDAEWCKVLVTRQMPSSGQPTSL